MKTTRRKLVSYSAIVQCEESALMVAIAIKAQSHDEARLLVCKQIQEAGGGMRLVNVAKAGTLADLG